MQTTTLFPPASLAAAQTTRDLIHDSTFCQRHRRHPCDFTRQRQLTFPNMITLLLQKSVRSIQLHLHDFFAALGRESATAGPSAWCEARQKLRHTAFIELNEKAILAVFYGPATPAAPSPRRWHGWRLVGIDSSLIRLPNSGHLGLTFGWVDCTNQQGEVGRYPQARLSVLTDVLNRIGLHTLLVPWHRGERDVAAEQLAALHADDLALLDRGYAAYELWARFLHRQRSFVCRCPPSSFRVVNQLFAENQAGRSVVAPCGLVPRQRRPSGRRGCRGRSPCAS